MSSDRKAQKRKSEPQTKRQNNSHATTHKKSLEKLKDTDPEFFKFLNNESKELLNFSLSESEGESDENQGSTKKTKLAKTNGKSKSTEVESASEADSDEDDTHRPPQKLLVQSDSEDEEEEVPEEEESEDEAVPAKRKKDVRQVVTTAMVNDWTLKLRRLTELSSTDNVLADVVQAFCAAVQQAGAKVDKEKEQKASLRYKVEGSIVFNAIVRLVVTELLPTLSRVLNLPKSKHKNKFPSPTQSKQWPSIKSTVRQYLGGLLKLLSAMAEADVVNALLKHTFQALPYFAQFPKIIKLLLRQLIVTWSRGEESSRVLAFLCINRIVRFHNKHLLDFALKKMYTSHVKNCRFVTPTTLPLISFMQRSLAELFSINFTLSYQFAFIYIRQLAIHLRNAITVKKKDTQQVVYSWQFIHSLHFWSRMLSQLHASDALKPLIYPLTQVILGTARLIPSARYYPLRFQCVRMLTQLSEATGTFIPVLPLITEVFELSNFNKKHKSLSLKPFNFACILKFSNAQLDDKAFKDGVIDQVYELLMNYLHVYSHTIAFPELVLPLTIQVRKFVKTCKVANYTKQLKQIVDKVEETAKVMMERRREAALNLADAKAVVEWERQSKDKGTPLSKYYATWRKLRDQELQLEASSKEHISMDDLPVIVRPKGPQKASEEEKQEFADIFKSDDEDSDDEMRFKLKEERGDKKAKKKSKKQDDSDSSDYSDFNDEELEQLARSASEDEGSDSDVGSDSEASDVEDDEDSMEDSDEEEEEVTSSAKSKSKKGVVNKPAVNQNKKSIKSHQVAVDNTPDEEDIVEDFQMSSDDESTNIPAKNRKLSKKPPVKGKNKPAVKKNSKKR